MNKAFNKTFSKEEDISSYFGGDPILLEMKACDFQCIDRTCSAVLILCSYNDYNIPAPYFKTDSKTPHNKDCKNKQYMYTYDPNNLSDRNTGISAFNSILSKLTDQPDKKVVIYNAESKTKEVLSRNTEDRKHYKKIKTGPIIYDGSTKITEETTYICSLSDCNINLEAKYLNLKGIGLHLTEESQEIINNEKNKEQLTLVFISKYINQNKESAWEYATKPNLLIIKKNTLLHHQKWTDFL